MLLMQRKQALHQVSNQTDPRASDKNGVVFNLAFGNCSKEADKKLFLLRHSSNLIFFNNKDLILTNFIQHFFGDLSPKDLQSILLYGGTTGEPMFSLSNVRGVLFEVCFSLRVPFPMSSWVLESFKPHRYIWEFYVYQSASTMD